MNFTYDEDIFSDLYKDVAGFRPRNHEFYGDDTTPERKQEIWDDLLVSHDEEMEHHKQMEMEAVVSFRKLVAETVEMGAGSFENALRWLKQAEGDDYYDDSYFRYSYRLPYSYPLA